MPVVGGALGDTSRRCNRMTHFVFGEPIGEWARNSSGDAGVEEKEKKK